MRKRNTSATKQKTEDTSAHNVDGNEYTRNPREAGSPGSRGGKTRGACGRQKPRRRCASGARRGGPCRAWTRTRRCSPLGGLGEPLWEGVPRRGVPSTWTWLDSQVPRLWQRAKQILVSAVVMAGIRGGVMLLRHPTAPPPLTQP